MDFVCLKLLYRLVPKSISQIFFKAPKMEFKVSRFSKLTPVTWKICNPSLQTIIAVTKSVISSGVWTRLAHVNDSPVFVWLKRGAKFFLKKLETSYLFSLKFFFFFKKENVEKGTPNWPSNYTLCSRKQKLQNAENYVQFLVWRRVNRTKIINRRFAHWQSVALNFKLPKKV